MYERSRRGGQPRLISVRFITKTEDAHLGSDLFLLSPLMDRLPSGAESLIANLPIHNANAWLESLTWRQPGRVSVAAAIFAADPFLDIPALFGKVSRAGLYGVATWPSVGMFGGSPDFSAVGLGFEREIDFVRMAKAEGLDVTATVFEPAQVDQMLDAGANRLILHPPVNTQADTGAEALANWVRSMLLGSKRKGVEYLLYFPKRRTIPAAVRSLIEGCVLPPVQLLQRDVPRVRNTQRERQKSPRKGTPSELPFAGRRRKGMIVGAGVSTGAASRAVAKGGADFIVALSAGRFRMMGAPSSAAYLPLREANSFVDSFAREEILLHSPIPVFLGVFASDPHYRVDDIVARVLERGYHGISNFPTIARYAGRYRDGLEASGYGIQREFDLISKARQAGLATLAYARNAEEAVQFAALGADLLCLQFGSNVMRSAVPSPDQIEDISAKAGAIFRQSRARNPHVLCLLSGGLILNPENMVRICGLAKADGYIGGSTLDQIPLESSIEDRTAEFKGAPDLLHDAGDVERQIRLYRHFGLVTTASDSVAVHARIKHVASGRHAVVISGEAGTGKSSLAKLIHSIGPFRQRRLEALSLDVKSSGVSEASLAGLAAEAAGNRQARLGWFQVLSGQTLVLDRLEKAGPSIQALLLEALDTGRFHPLGGTSSLPFDLRLILTSRQPLADLCASGQLMEDLYLKLQSSEIVLRPLRARLEDVPILVQFLLEDIGRDFGGATPGIEHAALRALQIQDWPGNIRALRAVLEDAMLLSSGRKIMLEHVDAARRKNEKPSVQPKEITERDWIGDALRRNRFRRCETAAFLGISRKTLYSKIKHYGLLAER